MNVIEWFKRNLIHPNYSKVAIEDFNPVSKFFHNTVVFGLSIWLHVTRKLTTNGTEHIPSDRSLNYVVASNHVSMADIPVMTYLMRYRPVAFLAKKELFDHWFTGRFFHVTGNIALNRDKPELSTIKSALNALKSKGWLLGIFPEGTRNTELLTDYIEKPPEIKAKRGVAYFAHAAKVPVLPMGIFYAGKKKRHIFVEIGELIPYQPDQELMSAHVADVMKQLLFNAQQKAASVYPDTIKIFTQQDN